MPLSQEALNTPAVEVDLQDPVLLSFRLYPAHDAGITCLALAKDSENNTWYVLFPSLRIVKIYDPYYVVKRVCDTFASQFSTAIYLEDQFASPRSVHQLQQILCSNDFDKKFFCVAYFLVVTECLLRIMSNDNDSYEQ